MTIDEHRIPVVIGSAQATVRTADVDVAELAERVSAEALDLVGGVRDAVGRVTVVRTLSPSGPALATALARRLGLQPRECESTYTGGETPQALVGRAAADIARGELDATLIAGAEVMRSVKAGHAQLPPDTQGDPDPEYGSDRLGTGEVENKARLFLPVHIYAMFESAIAASLGHGTEEHRVHLGKMLAPFASTAARHPYAWFTDAPGAEEIATPTPSNRMVAEPYTKRMAAFLAVDQAAAVVVSSLAAARAAGVADRAVFVWSGASCNDVWEPVSRPLYTSSVGIATAAHAALDSVEIALDDVDHIDLYSCFPAAVGVAADALDLALDDPRGLTVTGGLPYFGGPGNNYSTHAIATLTDRLRATGSGTGLVGALGWYNTKHAYGLYGAQPPSTGFRTADLTEEQARIDETTLPATREGDGQEGVIAAATVVHDATGPVSAPAFITLDDGRRTAANAVDTLVPDLAGTNAVGRRARLLPKQRYEIVD